MEPKLSELGEFAVIDKWILPHLRNVGQEWNDGASIGIGPAGRAIWTIDPMPTPLVASIEEVDPKVYGWYTVLPSASDLAACGATSHGVLVATELPRETSGEWFCRYQEGIQDACHSHGLKLLGGNIAEGSELKAVCTALGYVENSELERLPIYEDSVVVLVGETGYFSAGILAKYLSLSIESQLSAKCDETVFRPKAQTGAGKILGSLPFEVRCMDCSDGVLTSIFQLAQKAKIDVVLKDISSLIPEELLSVYLRSEVDPGAAFLGWGDWQLLAVFESKEYAKVSGALERAGVRCFAIGKTKKGTGKVLSTCEKGELNLDLVNQRFKGPIYSSGIEDVIDGFWRKPLFRY